MMVLSYRKIKNGLGDYVEVNHAVLRNELEELLSTFESGMDWYICGTDKKTEVFLNNESINQSAVNDAVLFHG